MSIRSALQAVARPSDDSIDIADSEGNTPARVGVGRLRWQSCPSNAPLFMHGGEFPPNSILGNSTSFERNKDSRSK
jgi:hypothetical protein